MKKLLSLLALLLPTMALALPFVPTTSPNTLPIHWYYLKTGNKYVYASPDPTGMTESDLFVSSSAANTDSYLWCFVGNSSSGYRIYNRATQSYLYAGRHILFHGSQSQEMEDLCQSQGERPMDSNRRG